MNKSFDKVWARIQSCSGSVFTTKTGLEYSYEAHENYIRLSNTQRNISITQFRRAFELVPVDGPGDLSGFQGPSYLWGILMDQRVRGELY